jgi:hypothetical protein
LIGGLAGAATLVLGGSLAGLLFCDSRAVWIAGVVRRNLPDVLVDEESIEIFVRHVLASGLLDSHKKRLAVLADTVIPALSRNIAPARERLEVFERLVLTEFLMGSNFFTVGDPKSQAITYSGKVLACGNRFAVLS